MKIVYRYDIQLTVEQLVALPQGAQLLTIERQTRLPLGMSLWALVDTDNLVVDRKIILRGTGADEIPEGATFINTYQEPSGYVWHFFDGGEEL